ncbi:MAG: shikimate kinase [Patescibacteria group bacterium]
MNITLVGMPGSGKSFVGKKLADWLGYAFLDIDTSLEQKHYLLLQQIVEKLGDEAFLDAEAKATISQTNGRDNFVISPGGSIIYQTDAVNHLKKISKIIYLKVSLETLEKRIGDVPRGIIGFKDKTLTGLYDERIPLYEEHCDYTVNGDQEAETVVRDILKVMGK